MNKVRLGFIGLVVGLAWVCTPSLVGAQERVTLYSIHKHRNESRVFCFDFHPDPQSKRPCYFRYGALYVGNDHDWFESSAVRGNRSVIKDLGEQDWAEQFEVPVVEPLRELQPGERRVITIDASGADGADGVSGDRGRDGVNADGSFRTTIKHETNAKTGERNAKRKHDGKPRVDPSFVKAVVGHMYVMHVVNETDDFYVLFRVEQIERGSSCTISWKRVPAPSAQVGRN